MYIVVALSKTKKIFYLLSVFTLSNIYSMQMGKPLMIPQRLGDIKVHYKDKDFFVEKESKFTPIDRWNVDKSLRGIPKDRLVKLLASGAYLQLNKYENCDEYNLKLKGRLCGGGPLTANFLYWATKSICYGTAIAGTGAIVVTTGGAAGAASATLAAASTLGASTGSTLVGAAIAGAGLTTEAALATTAIVSGSGSIAAAAATIEGASTFMAAVGLWLPLP